MTLDRHLAIVSVPEHHIIEALYRRSLTGSDVVLSWPSMPAEFDYVSVHHDHWNRCFLFCVRSPAFAEVLPGRRLPEIAGEYTLREYPSGTVTGHVGSISATAAHDPDVDSAAHVAAPEI